MRMLFPLLLLAVPFSFLPAQEATAREESWILHTYEVKFRLKGIVSTTQVQAGDAGQAKKLVEAQFGKEVTILSTKRLKEVVLERPSWCVFFEPLGDFHPGHFSGNASPTPP